MWVFSFLSFLDLASIGTFLVLSIFFFFLSSLILFISFISSTAFSSSNFSLAFSLPLAIFLVLSFFSTVFDNFLFI